MDLRIGDLVDITTECVIPPRKGPNGYIVVGFNRKESPKRRVLIEGLYTGHSGPQQGVLTDHKGEPVEFHSKGSIYWWVNTSSVSKIDSIKLTKSQIKRIIS